MQRFLIVNITHLLNSQSVNCYFVRPFPPPPLPLPVYHTSSLFLSFLFRRSAKLSVSQSNNLSISVMYKLINLFGLDLFRRSADLSLYQSVYRSICKSVNKSIFLSLQRNFFWDSVGAGSFFFLSFSESQFLSISISLFFFSLFFLV